MKQFAVRMHPSKPQAPNKKCDEVVDKNNKKKWLQDKWGTKGNTTGSENNAKSQWGTEHTEEHNVFS